MKKSAFIQSHRRVGFEFAKASLLMRLVYESVTLG